MHKPERRRDHDEALNHLRALLRIDTTNPPGREDVAVDYIQKALAHEAIETTRLRSKGGRENLVARLRGDGSESPLLLVAHLDVVPADPTQWRYPPFGGDEAEGCLWGRGALDMKNMAAMCIVMLQRLARAGIPLKRDIIFAAVADEETGCEEGSRFLVENHPELVQAEYMIGEVGGYTLHLNGRRYYPVQVAEKGVAWLKLTVKGRPGHGSIPRADNPVVQLGHVLAKLGTTPLPQHNTAGVERFLHRLAPSQPAPARYVLPLLLNPRLSGLILDRLIPDPSVADGFRALLHNTVSPTVLEGGTSINVVPGEASVLLDGRTLPGQTTADLIDEIRSILDIDVEIRPIRSMPPIEMAPESPLYDAMMRVIARHDPGATVIPYLIPGFTDAKYFSQLGMKCYGFVPLRLPEGFAFSQLFHGHDERIPIDGFLWGIEVLHDLVRSFAGAEDG